MDFHPSGHPTEHIYYVVYSWQIKNCSLGKQITGLVLASSLGAKTLHSIIFGKILQGWKYLKTKSFLKMKTSFLFIITPVKIQLKLSSGKFLLPIVSSNESLAITPYSAWFDPPKRVHQAADVAHFWLTQTVLFRSKIANINGLTRPDVDPTKTTNFVRQYDPVCSFSVVTML